MVSMRNRNCQRAALSTSVRFTGLSAETGKSHTVSVCYSFQGTDDSCFISRNLSLSSSFSPSASASAPSSSSVYLHLVLLPSPHPALTCHNRFQMHCQVHQWLADNISGRAPELPPSSILQNHLIWPPLFFYEKSFYSKKNVKHHLKTK